MNHKNHNHRPKAVANLHFALGLARSHGLPGAFGSPFMRGGTIIRMVRLVIVAAAFAAVMYGDDITLPLDGGSISINAQFIKVLLDTLQLEVAHIGGRELFSWLASISTDPQMVGLRPVLQGETLANWAVADIGH